MNSHNGIHLDEDQILHAVVDEADLLPTLREHLSACPQCRANKEIIKQDLERLGNLAKRFTPLPKKQVSLPVEKVRAFSPWSWNWQASLGAAVTAAVLVIFVVWLTGPFRTTPGDNADIIAWEFFEPDPILTEIRILAENALPSVYQDISGEYDSSLDKEFIRFIVPSVDNEPLTYEEGEKWARIC